MKYISILVIVFLLIISCSKQSDLSKKFDCKEVAYQNTQTVKDFKNNFKLVIPSSWKTNLYYNEFQSEVYSADTTKQLTETFILGASFNYGKAIFDTSFYKKTDSILAINDLTIIDSGNEKFKSKPTYWYLSKGLKNGYTYHQFNLTSIQSENTYFNAYAEIYGDNNLNERICETISILEKLEFLQ